MLLYHQKSQLKTIQENQSLCPHMVKVMLQDCTNLTVISENK